MKILLAPLGMGSAALAAAVALPSLGDLNFPQEINEVLNNIKCAPSLGQVQGQPGS